ncbi:GDSL-type esterase/lipase family protein [Paenibacillus sp. LjRoot153]|uniref:GDSL-type esterase/lipase family protein n=1 Tax=Paenibacillus sp. LjRoot153 TaxID=3342270 RepID=UPI003ECD93F4
MPFIFTGIVVLVLGIVYWYLGYLGFTAIPIGKRVKKGDVRIACIGDSITYGLLIKNWYRFNYPYVLGRMLGKGYNVRNFGVSGRTAMETGDHPYKKEYRYQRSKNYQPHLVLIMFGTNDSKPHNWKGKEEFKRQIKKLIRGYQELDSQPFVYLLTPATPYYKDGVSSGHMMFDVRKAEIKEAADAVKELSEEMNLGIIDIHKETAGHRGWFVSDGIHPNAIGAEAIAKVTYKHIKEAG